MTTPQQLEEEMLSNPVRSLQYMLRRLAGKYHSVNAAIAARPKLFTRLCTHRMPKFMMDC